MRKNPSSSSSSLHLKTLVEDHWLFFDNLVKLIPSRFYLSNPDGDADDGEKPWFQGLSKAAKASAKKQSRQNLKKSRRLRFNPDHPSSTLDVLHNSIKSSNASTKSDAADQSVTYEELRQRLHQRIQDLRSKRNTRPKIEPRNEEENNKNKNLKRKMEERSDDGGRKKESDEKLVGGDIAFGKVKVGDEDDKRGKKKKKKVSKVRELEKAEKLAEMKKDPDKVEKVSWKAAESRAMGVKVHDNPKILKESIKKEKKRQKKSADKWKERVESRESMRREKQKTRSDNIKERIQQKKMRRIEKREKKLMRPGFEGRKEGYINE